MAEQIIAEADLTDTDRADQARGLIVEVATGWFWRATRTRFGTTTPRTLDLALRIGGTGTGPCGYAGVHHLGLTTQVPATLTIAVAETPAVNLPTVRWEARGPQRRTHAPTPTEVALIETVHELALIEADNPLEALGAAARQAQQLGLVDRTRVRDLLHAEEADAAWAQLTDVW